MTATVLVCDNEEVLRTLVRATLGERGYVVAEAADGEESLEVARRTKPDLLILDLLMPGRDGLEVLSQLRRDPAFVETPVIVLTARAQAAARDAALRASADRFLVKPFSPRELLAAVDEFLAETSSHERVRRSTTPLASRERHAHLVRERVARAAAQASAEEYRSLADALPHQVWTARPDGSIDYVNRRFEEYAGGSSPSPDLERLVHPDDAARFREEWAAARERGDALDSEVRLRRADGSYRRHLVRAVAQRSEAGEVEGWVGTCTDVHDRPPARSSPAAGRADAESAAGERLAADLVATASHELRAPLTGVLGFAEVVLDRTLREQTRREYLETIYNEAQRLARIVDTVLDSEQFGSGEPSLRCERFFSDQLLAETAEVFSASSPAHKIKLELAEEPLEVVADRDRIARVVSNLLANAIAYSPEGGAVRVRSERVNGRVRVSISDQGVGIPDEERDKIFSRFFRGVAGGERATPGLGLGLALARDIVRAHGGEMGFESTQGAGSTFWFELPRVA